MTKAIMVNTATDVVGGDDGAGGINASVPTQVQGWGRINLGNVLDGDPAPVRRPDVADSAPPARRERSTYAVADTAKPLKVTLAWTDAPGPTTGNAFVNDLDLEVNAGGQTLQGQRVLRRPVGTRRQRRPAQQPRERLPAGRGSAARSRST